MNIKYFTFPISPWNWLFVSHHVCKYSVELNVSFPISITPRTLLTPQDTRLTFCGRNQKPQGETKLQLQPNFMQIVREFCECWVLMSTFSGWILCYFCEDTKSGAGRQDGKEQRTIRKEQTKNEQRQPKKARRTIVVTVSGACLIKMRRQCERFIWAA